MTMPRSIEESIERRIASGKYKDAAEVLNTAFSALELYEEDIESIRQGIDEGIEDARCGRFVPADEAFAKLRAPLLERVKKAAP